MERSTYLVVLTTVLVAALAGMWALTVLFSGTLNFGEWILAAVVLAAAALVIRACIRRIWRVK